MNNQYFLKVHGKMYLHLILSLLLLPLIINLGPILKLIFVPYVLFLIFSKDSQYFPALIILSSAGSTISIFIFIIIILLSFFNYNFLKRLHVDLLFLVSLIPLPFFLIQLFITLYNGENFLLDLQHWSLYLGIFPFFYGLIIGVNFNKNILSGIFIALVLLMLFSWASPLVGVIRLSSLISIYFLVIGVYIIFMFTKRSNIHWMLKLVGLIYVISLVLGFSEVKFHSFFSILLAFFIILAVRRNQFVFLKYLTNPFFYFSLGVLMIFIILNFQHYGETEINNYEIEYSNFSDYYDYIIYKAFSDRGVIWSGVWTSLRESNLWWPPEKPLIYDYITAGGTEFSEIQFGAHNIPLELMRNYGFILGILISVIYIIYLMKLSRSFFYFNNDFIFLSISATLFSIGLVIGMTGQSTLQPNSSFAFMGFIGVIISLKYFDFENQIK